MSHRNPKQQRERENSQKVMEDLAKASHMMVTGLNPNENVDPSRWTCFLASINNIVITDKVLHGKTLLHNFEDAMKKAIQLEAGFQLSEGVNMARRINVMQAEVNEM